MKIFGYLGMFLSLGLGKAKRWGNEMAGRSHEMLRTAGSGGGELRGVSERSGGGGQGRHSAAVGGRLFPFP